MESTQDGVAIFAACLPILPPAIKHMLRGSTKASFARRNTQQLSRVRGALVWIRTIGGRRIAITGSGASADYIGLFAGPRHNDGARSDNVGEDSLEIGRVEDV